MCLNIYIGFKYCTCCIFSQVTTAHDASDFWSRSGIHRQSDECLIHEANFIEELRSKYPFTLHVALPLLQPACTPAIRALTPFPPLLARPPRGQEGIASTVGRPEIVWVQVPHAAIDADHLPGDKVREVGGEELNHLGAIFRLSQTSHRNVRH